MDLSKTTIIDIILYIILVLSIIALVIGLCIGSELMKDISAVIIFSVVIIFLIANTFRHIAYKK